MLRQCIIIIIDRGRYTQNHGRAGGAGVPGNPTKNLDRLRHVFLPLRIYFTYLSPSPSPSPSPPSLPLPSLSLSLSPSLYLPLPLSLSLCLSPSLSVSLSLALISLSALFPHSTLSICFLSQTVPFSLLHLFQNTLRPQKNCNSIILSGFVFSNYLKKNIHKIGKNRISDSGVI